MKWKWVKRWMEAKLDDVNDSIGGVEERREKTERWVHSARSAIQGVEAAIERQTKRIDELAEEGRQLPESNSRDAIIDLSDRIDENRERCIDSDQAIITRMSEIEAALNKLEARESVQEFVESTRLIGLAWEKLKEIEATMAQWRERSIAGKAEVEKRMDKQQDQINGTLAAIDKLSHRFQELTAAIDTLAAG